MMLHSVPSCQSICYQVQICNIFYILKKFDRLNLWDSLSMVLDKKSHFVCFETGLLRKIPWFGMS